MVPPKKKRKVVPPPQQAPEAADNSNPPPSSQTQHSEGGAAASAVPAVAEMANPQAAVSISSPPTIAALDNMLDRFLGCLEDNEKASYCLLDIKSFQRTVVRQLEATEQRLTARHEAVGQHYKTLASLEYEQSYIESKIKQIEQNSQIYDLEAMCREELNDFKSDQSTVLTNFLQHDISQATQDSQSVMAFITSQIDARKELQDTVQKKRQEHKNLAALTKKRTQFLHQLPDKLKEMEKASMPLQRSFAKAAANAKETGLTSNGARKFNTSDRDDRLRLARELPGPLYTLLVQLQSYMDDYPHKSMSLDIGNLTSIVPKSASSTAADNTADVDKGDADEAVLTPHDKIILWQIPIPNVAATATVAPSNTGRSSPTASPSASSFKKMMTIAFLYFEDLQVVTAKVTSGDDSKMIDVATVLQLNPYDTGDKDSRFHNHKTASSSSSGSAALLYGKPYLWCNYLAGLQLVNGAHPHEQIQASTRVIVATLLRHLRANATLHYILHRVLPSHPRASALPPAVSSSATSSCLAKIVSVQSVTPDEEEAAGTGAVTGTETSETSKKYKIHCKRGNHSLQAICHVNLALYPVLQPPQWSLTGNALQWGQDHGSQDALMMAMDTSTNITTNDATTTASGGSGSSCAPPLHQARLAALEGRVNDIDGLVDYLKQKKANDKEDDKDDGDDDDDEDGNEMVEPYFYDWILTHQLREILVEWDDWITTGDNTNAADASTPNASNSGNVAAGTRTVRGRDRAKVE